MNVAVIVPTRDRPDLLRRAVDSIAAQDKKAAEIIIVDDGESQERPQGGNIQYIKTRGGIGPTRARSLAVQSLSPGTDAVCYLDDDDELLPNHLRLLSAELEKGKQFAFSRAVYRYPDGYETEDPEPGNNSPDKSYYDANSLLRQNIAPISSFMHTRGAYWAIGGWDKDLLRMEDWDFWGRMFIQFGPPGFVNEVTNVIYKGLGANRTDSNPYVYAMSCHWRDVVADRLKFLEGKGRGKFVGNERHLFSVPKIGVVMPVYNARAHLEESLNSLLGQTFQDFEIIALDDGSTDGSLDMLAKFSAQNKGKIRIYASKSNQGVTRTLNRGLLIARSQYVARMDADDVSLPERFEKQVNYLDAHPEVGILGTRFWSMDEELKRVTWENNVPTDPDEVARTMLEHCCLGHPTVMMRRRVVEVLGGYDEDDRCKTVEDYEFWLRALREFRVANLPDFLLKYREHEGQVTKVSSEMQKRNFEFVRSKYQIMETKNAD